MTRPPRPKRAAPPHSLSPDPLPAGGSSDGLPLWLFAGIIAVPALALRLLHLWDIKQATFFSVLMGDARAYDAWAQRLAGGDWVGTEVFYQAPLYPYFLGVIYAVAGHDLLLVRVVQALLGSASCVLLGLTARRLFSQRAGLIAGVALAVYAPAIFFDGLMQKSVLDVFFICLSLWLISGLSIDPGRTASWVALGLTMGGLSLTRENALALVAVVGVWAAFGVRAALPVRGRAAAVFAAAVAIVLVPVAIRNYAVGGGFYLTTAQFGPNFYIGNNPGADGTYASLRFGRGAPEYERQDATDLAQRAAGRTLTPSEVSAYWTDRALDFITTQPGRWSRLMGRKLLLLSNASEMLDTESQETYADESWPLRATGWLTHFGVLVPLALFGAVTVWPARRSLGVFYALTGTYAASVLVFYVFARYRFPLVPMLVLFAAAGLAALPGWLRVTARSRLVAVAGAVVAALVVTNWPVLSPTLMRAITETNLATALQSENRIDEAVRHYQRAIAWQPDYAPAHNNLGTALRAQGRLDDAIATYERALAVAADYPDAHYNLANALLERNRPELAARHFQVALQSMPDSAETHNNLGIALMNQQRYDEAIAAFRDALTIAPASTQTLRNLASALDARGHVDEAVETLQQAIALDPQDAAALYDLGSTMLEAGQMEAAIDAFRKALAITPQSVEAHNNLGIALGSLGRMAEAAAEFERALAIRPDFADARRNLELARAAGAGQR